MRVPDLPPPLVRLCGLCLLTLMFVFHTHSASASREEVSGLRVDLGDGPWVVEANRAEYDEDTQQIILTGDVRITREDRELFADRVIYHRGLQSAEAEGNVLFILPEGALRGDHLWLDLDSRLGRIQAGELFIRDGNFHIRADLLEKIGANRFHLRNSTFTTCDAELPDWRFRGRKIHMAVDGYARIQSAHFEIRGFPVLYVPYLIIPVKVTRQTGFLIPRPEYSNRSGAGLDIPFFWAISEQTDATFHQHILGRRGLKQGVEYRYLLKDYSRGLIQLDYLNDRLEDDNFFDDGFSRTNRNRWWLRSKHDQSLPSGVLLKADLDLVSDQDFIREFKSSFSGFEDSNRVFEKDFHRDLEEDSALFRKSVVGATRNWDRFGLYGNMTYLQALVKQPENSIAQQMPALSFRSPGVRMGEAPLFGHLDSGYTYFFRDDGHKGQRLFAAPQVSLPVDTGMGVVFRPFAGVKETVYHVDRGEPGVDTGVSRRGEIQMGAEASTLLSRVFNIETGRLRALRHQVKPLVAYEYRTVDAPSHGPAFDPDDTADALNRVSAALQNVWTGRFVGPDGAPTFRDIGRLKISQDYNIREARRDLLSGEDERRPFSDLLFEIEVYPASNLQILLDTAWDVYDDRVRTFNAFVVAHDARGDRLSLDYRYSADHIEQLNAELLVKVTDEFFLFGNTKRSLESDQTVETAVGALMRLQCWGMEVKFEKQESESRFMVRFSLEGIGETGPLRAAF